MSTTEIPENHESRPLLGLGLSDGLGHTPRPVERPYCRECGSEKLRYDYECASGHVYQCKRCGTEMQWTFPLVA